MLAIVRKRRAVISEVRPFDGEDGVLHLVGLEYKDNETPDAESVVWEREPCCELLNPTAIPRSSDRPMPADEFDAVVRAARWSALSPYLDPDGDGPLDRMPICSPFHGAVQVEDYQLVPLLKALRMPRISLMIADDVGLGKTVEAGLILRELLIRRRIRRILVLTPASLRIQWRDEMWDKFSLPFDVVDRASTHQLRRSIGIDANPWRSSSRAIASYHYLKQPDVLAQFHSACRTGDDSPHLPWDLLIVDECHNLMPAPFGEDSDLCKMLRLVAPHFEHKLFLTATPHNGRTRSFSGLLELLDPVRFSQTDELKPAERKRIEQVVVRRLKRDINARTDPPKFASRAEPQALPLTFHRSEQALIDAVDRFRDAVRRVIASGDNRRRISGSFAIEILGKRLLSGPATFAESWRRCKLGLLEDEQAGDAEVAAASRSVHDETSDDTESQQREATASTVIGAWLRNLVDDVDAEIADVDAAVEGLGFDLTSETVPSTDPSADARFGVLKELIETQLTRDGDWIHDERLIVFTEYKTTLEYVLRRLRADYPGEQGAFLTLFGGMDDREREQIKEKFNDPDSDVRVLIATDAASEGLNLQETARHLLHYDCPWNPSRIEQRNGRLDRHGQARDVLTYHFISHENADLRFMSHLIGKVDQQREDLGAVGAILDEAMHRRMIDGEDAESVQQQLELQLATAQGRADVDGDDTVSIDGPDSSDGPAPKERAGSNDVAAPNGRADPNEPSDLAQERQHAGRLEALAAELDLDPDAERELLDVAMGIHAGRPQLTPTDPTGRCRILNPSLPQWSDTIDQTVRRGATGAALGALPYLAFSPEPCLRDVGGRIVFRPPANLQLMHLGHPLFTKALSVLGRRRFPGPSSVSRWTVRAGGVPDGADALLLLHVEELAVNRLRETFHHWVRTVRYPVHGDTLGAPLAHAAARELRAATSTDDAALGDRAADLLADVELDLQDEIKRMTGELTEKLIQQLDVDGTRAIDEESKNYQSRQGEVSALIAENTLEHLEREIVRLKAERQAGYLFDGQAHLDDIDRSIEKKEEEKRRREEHYEEVREQLTRERERVVHRLLPKRYALDGDASIFPLAVEIRLPD